MTEGEQKSSSRKREIFLGALDCATEGERAVYLDQACGDDRELRALVEALLRAHEDGAFMQAPAGGEIWGSKVRGTSEPVHGEQLGDRIGPYRLERVLGQGGFGTVYLAQQEAPIRRSVALKILRPGMDTKSVMARFEVERQSLAWMDHPCVARVLDAGASAGGRPYFAMEYVEGLPITQHCERSGLSLVERLRLFLGVCQAIEHAHQKGVIHRDVKPSNVLVGVVHGVAMPKVIDFGIAKALDPGGAESSSLTTMVAMLGTPAYMSPEQAGSGGGGVDTRTDVYGLGALLYEVLTGWPPFDPKRLAGMDFAELNQVLREEVPTRPSRCRAGLEELRGDLDWVVMKCLEKDRSRRYATVNDLAQDVQRYLDGAPVVARPPSAGYLVRKFVGRHRLSVTAATLVTLSLVGGLGVALWQVREQRRLAEVAEVAKLEQERLRTLADAAAGSARFQAYVADINLAALAIRDRQFGRAWRGLEAHVARPGETDLRGWEWEYLAQSCASEAWYTFGQWPGGVAVMEPSPDGKWVAVGGKEGGVGLWDVEERRELEHWLTGDDSAVLAVSPAGGSLAFRVKDGNEEGEKIRVWDVETQSVVFEARVSGSVMGLKYDSVGEELLAVMSTGDWVKWSVMDGSEKGRGFLTLMKDWAGLDLDVDREWVGFSGWDGSMGVVELETGHVRWERGFSTRGPEPVMFTEDGRFLARFVRSSAGVLFLDIDNGAPSGSIIAGAGRRHVIRFSPDGARLASAGVDQWVTLNLVRYTDLQRLRPALVGPDPLTGLNLMEGMERTRPRIRIGQVSGEEHRPHVMLRGHKSQIHALAWLTDERTLLSAGADGQILAWDTKRVRRDPVEPYVVPDAARSWGWAVGPEGEGCLLTVDGEGGVKRWSWEEELKGEPLFQMDVGDGPILISERGDLLATVGGEGQVEVWDVVTKERRWMVSVGGEPIALLALRPESGRLVIRDGEGRFHEWDYWKGTIVRTWGDSEEGTKSLAALSANGQWCVTLTGGGVTKVHDLEAGSEGKFLIGVRRAAQVFLDPEGRHIVVLDRTGVGSVWDRFTGARRATLEGFQDPIRAIGFSTDGRRLVAVGEGLEGVRIYETEAFRELMKLGAELATADSVAFAPDGRGLAVGSVEGKVIVWRTQ